MKYVDEVRYSKEARNFLKKAEPKLITINNLLKSLVKSWDPEFVRVTKSEAARLKKIEKEMDSGEYFTEDEVWQ